MDQCISAYSGDGGNAKRRSRVASPWSGGCCGERASAAARVEQAAVAAGAVAQAGEGAVAAAAALGCFVEGA